MSASHITSCGGTRDYFLLLQIDNGLHDMLSAPAGAATSVAGKATYCRP